MMFVATSSTPASDFHSLRKIVGGRGLMHAPIHEVRRSSLPNQYGDMAVPDARRLKELFSGRFTTIVTRHGNRIEKH
jgi:hypothetical protein